MMKGVSRDRHLYMSQNVGVSKKFKVFSNKVETEKEIFCISILITYYHRKIFHLPELACKH